jgi:hypothetical protein
MSATEKEEDQIIEQIMRVLANKEVTASDQAY